MIENGGPVGMMLEMVSRLHEDEVFHPFHMMVCKIDDDAQIVETISSEDDVIRAGRRVEGIDRNEKIGHGYYQSMYF